ncbi:MAG: matrixin family metalloprotease [Cytophagales bacterium]|nr:matrixin family metalloprotease [Cytophagales bacterium]
MLKDSLDNYFNLYTNITYIRENIHIENALANDIIYAKPLLDTLEKKRISTDSIKTIFITDKKLSIIELPINKDASYDLKYLIRGLTSSISGNFGIVSTYKLKMESVDNVHFQNLLVKTMRHEIGHLLGLHHCRNDNCLMKSGYDPLIFQNIDYYLCNKCRTMLVSR